VSSLLSGADSSADEQFCGNATNGFGISTNLRHAAEELQVTAL
jgi:hypothetical protein